MRRHRTKGGRGSGRGVPVTLNMRAGGVMTASCRRYSRQRHTRAIEEGRTPDWWHGNEPPPNNPCSRPQSRASDVRLPRVYSSSPPLSIPVGHRSEERREGKSESVRVELGGRRIFTKKVEIMHNS